CLSVCARRSDGLITGHVQPVARPREHAEASAVPEPLLADSPRVRAAPSCARAARRADGLRVRAASFAARAAPAVGGPRARAAGGAAPPGPANAHLVALASYRRLGRLACPHGLTSPNPPLSRTLGDMPRHATNSG